MKSDNDVIDFMLKEGTSMFIRAEGNPATIVAGAVVVGALSLSYGGYRYGSKLIDYLAEDIFGS